MEPLIKWLGGKRQLLGVLRARMPRHYQTYYEPFLGGGALFLASEPRKSVLGDTNASLIHMYQAVKDSPEAVSRLLLQLQKDYNTLPGMNFKDTYYMQRRTEYNRYLSGKQSDPVTEACLLIFLNKTGFNGVYRVNKKGEYNVPSAHRETVALPSGEEIFGVSDLLAGADIQCRDFEETVSTASSQDFVFFDSPYHETFDQYQKSGFSEDEHCRLARLFAELSDRDVSCMLTNSDTPFIRELYKNYRIEQVPVHRAVNRDGGARTGVELVIRNY